MRSKMPNSIIKERARHFLVQLAQEATIPVKDIKTVKDVPAIAKKHGVSVDEIMAELEKGQKVEREHTENDEAAIDIALDHLDELPDYYTKLHKMEKGKLKEGFIGETAGEKVRKNYMKKFKGRTITGKKANDVIVNPEIDNGRDGYYK